METILAIDVGTTAFKMGVFDRSLRPVVESSIDYEVNVYGDGKADIEPEKWWSALKTACGKMRSHLKSVCVVSLSVTTPGLVPMDDEGRALLPAILFFDGRSKKQARWIRNRIGEQFFLRETGNLPVSGGSSLSSILWIRENQPAVWERTAKFGHCNTYMVRRLTGEWAIDPSTTSITGLYNTRRNDLTWNQKVLKASGIPGRMLPPLLQSSDSAGTVTPNAARELGIPEGCPVLCGGNDAVLAALSAGLREPGNIVDIAGTCEIISVCLDNPLGSPNYNIRCHVVPDRWVTLFVLNTGGKSLDWFHSVFCTDMSRETFYTSFIPETIHRFFTENPDSREARLPGYVPFLGGSRYSLEPLKAEFRGITLETSREDFLLALLRDNNRYLKTHLDELSGSVDLEKVIVITGGGAGIEGMIPVKKQWMGNFRYRCLEQSSLTGAAMLGQFYLQRLFRSAQRERRFFRPR